MATAQAALPLLRTCLKEEKEAPSGAFFLATCPGYHWGMSNTIPPVVQGDCPYPCYAEDMAVPLEPCWGFIMVVGTTSDKEVGACEGHKPMYNGGAYDGSYRDPPGGVPTRPSMPVTKMCSLCNEWVCTHQGQT